MLQQFGGFVRLWCLKRSGCGQKDCVCVVDTDMILIVERCLRNDFTKRGDVNAELW